MNIDDYVKIQKIIQEEKTMCELIDSGELFTEDQRFKEKITFQLEKIEEIESLLNTLMVSSNY